MSCVLFAILPDWTFCSWPAAAHQKKKKMWHLKCPGARVGAECPVGSAVPLSTSGCKILLSFDFALVRGVELRRGGSSENWFFCLSRNTHVKKSHPSRLCCTLSPARPSVSMLSMGWVISVLWSGISCPAVFPVCNPSFKILKMHILKNVVFGEGCWIPRLQVPFDTTPECNLPQMTSPMEWNRPKPSGSHHDELTKYAFLAHFLRPRKMTP